MPKIEELNKQDQKNLLSALSVPLDELTDHNKTLLKARFSYLSKSQQKQYADILFPKKKVQENKSSKDTDKTKTNENKIPNDDKKDPELDKLIADAKELGIETKNLSKEEIEKAIDTKLAEE